MAVTSGVGHSRIIKNRRFEDYRSMKQYFSDRTITEVNIAGACTTAGAAAEICFVTGDVINYIAAEGQVYVRCEADDANQHSKYVYIQYQDDTGAIQTILTADLNAADSTTEVIVTGADDFYRLRQMISEVESASGGGKMVLLTDADWDGVADTYGAISDGQSAFCLERFFTQPSATCDSYLGKVTCKSVLQDADGAAAAGFILTVQYTPKVLGTSDGFTEAQVAADITRTFHFDQEFVWEPCILLEPATEVIFSLGDIDTAGTIDIDAWMLEVYATNSTPSS